MSEAFDSSYVKKQLFEKALLLFVAFGTLQFVEVPFIRYQEQVDRFRVIDDKKLEAFSVVWKDLYVCQHVVLERLSGLKDLMDIKSTSHVDELFNGILTEEGVTRLKIGCDKAIESARVNGLWLGRKNVLFLEKCATETKYFPINFRRYASVKDSSENLKTEKLLQIVIDKQEENLIKDEISTMFEMEERRDFIKSCLIEAERTVVSYALQINT